MWVCVHMCRWVYVQVLYTICPWDITNNQRCRKETKNVSLNRLDPEILAACGITFICFLMNDHVVVTSSTTKLWQKGLILCTHCTVPMTLLSWLIEDESISSVCSWHWHFDYYSKGIWRIADFFFLLKRRKENWLTLAICFTNHTCNPGKGALLYAKVASSLD